MGTIEDGRGRGFKAEVNAEQELVVRAITEAELEHSSAQGNAYSWDSTELNIDIGDTMLFVKNTGDIPLVVDSVHLNGAAGISMWHIGIGTATTTPAGALLTAVNLNTTFSGVGPDAIAYSDETAVADAPLIMRVNVPIDGHNRVDLTGVILGKGHYIQINQETEEARGSAIIIAHFELPS